MVPVAWFYLFASIAAGLSIGVGVVLPAVGQARVASQAMEAIARQPDEAGTVSRNLFISLAMIESLGLYVLIVALILLFADPLDNKAAAASAQGWSGIVFLSGSAIAAALTIVLGTTLAAVGQGKVAGAALRAIGEQPEARDDVSTTLFISLALLESLALYSLIVALIILFANPFIDKAIPG